MGVDRAQSGKGGEVEAQDAMEVAAEIELGLKGKKRHRRKPRTTDSHNKPQHGRAGQAALKN